MNQPTEPKKPEQKCECSVAGYNPRCPLHGTPAPSQPEASAEGEQQDWRNPTDLSQMIKNAEWLFDLYGSGQFVSPGLWHLCLTNIVGAIPSKLQALRDVEAKLARQADRAKMNSIALSAVSIKMAELFTKLAEAEREREIYKKALTRIRDGEWETDDECADDVAEKAFAAASALKSEGGGTP